MLTNFYFWIVLLLALLPYYAFKREMQSRYLLVLSWFFLGSLSLAALVLALFSGWFCYVACKQLSQQKNENYKKNIYRLHVAILLLLLVFARLYMYTHHTIVFVGISFYTLMLLALLTNVYEEKIASLSLEEVWHYQLFFPRLLQGPVQMPKDFFDQKTTGIFDQTKIVKGFLLILFGLLKKLAIADRLAFAANLAFDHPQGQTAWITLLCACLFSLQLYFDFSGYTDMARGLALLFGYELPLNFNSPFKAASITEFWRRWHMSFMQWLNKYVFSPLYFYLKHHSKLALPVAMLVTFTLSAWWHSVGLQFLIWGWFHAILIITEYYFFRKIKMPSFFSWCAPFIVFILFSIGNVFFHAHNMQEAMILFFNLFDVHNLLPTSLYSATIPYMAGGGEHEAIMNFYGYILLMVLTLFFEKAIYKAMEKERPYMLGLAIIFTLLLFGNFIHTEKFIYTNF